MAKAVIIEDHSEYAQKLSSELKSQQFEEVKAFSTVKSATHFLLKSNEIELVFLSLEVENNTGMNLFKQAPIQSELVLISHPTEFLEVAVEEFCVSHIFRSNKEQKSILQTLSTNPKKTDKAGLARRLISHYDPNNKWYLAQKKGRFHTIQLDEISYFQRMENDSVIRTFEGTVYTLNKSFDVLKHDFADSDFFVPHPDYLIRKDRYNVQKFNGKAFLMLKAPSVRIPLLNSNRILDSNQSIYINSSKQ